MTKHALRIVFGLVGLCLLAQASAPRAQADEPRRSVTYYGDRRIELPQRVTRIATAWEAQNSIIAMLGYGDRIVATTRIVRSMPVFRKFVPTIKDAALASGGSAADINVEEMVALRPDILFVPDMLPAQQAGQLAQAGIAVAAFRYNAIDAIVERTLITGEMLGPDAAAIAQRYAAYFEDNRRRVRERLEKVPSSARRKVYLASGTPLATSGRPSLNQDWMDLAGAVNVAEAWFGSMPNRTGTASLEDILAADPDVIVAMRARDAAEIRTNPQWRHLRAVRDGRVYANPRGLFWWCRETSEEALQFLWLAKTLYPDAFADIDMLAETKRFYRDFYRIDLTDAEAQDFLAPGDPAL